MYRLYCEGTAALDDADFTKVVEGFIQAGADGKIFTGPVDGVKGNISAYFKRKQSAEIAAYAVLAVSEEKSVPVEVDIDNVKMLKI